MPRLDELYHPAFGNNQPAVFIEKEPLRLGKDDPAARRHKVLLQRIFNPGNKSCQAAENLRFPAAVSGTWRPNNIGAHNGYGSMYKAQPGWSMYHGHNGKGMAVLRGAFYRYTHCYCADQNLWEAASWKYLVFFILQYTERIVCLPFQFEIQVPRRSSSSDALSRTDDSDRIPGAIL